MKNVWSDLSKLADLAEAARRELPLSTVTVEWPACIAVEVLKYGRTFYVWFGSANNTVTGDINELVNGVVEPTGAGVETFVATDCPHVKVIAAGIAAAVEQFQEEL